jgi:drug/metabolite transporter (DMT)-like permease
VTPRKYLVLAGVSLFAAIGDTLLSRGMKEMGAVSLHHLASILLVVFQPKLALGVAFLLAFFACYMTALSWADLTFVLPATSLSYVLVTVLGRYVLHEQVSTARWIGVLLIAAGVGFVTQGPELTHKRHSEPSESQEPSIPPTAVPELRQ